MSKKEKTPSKKKRISQNEQDIARLTAENVQLHSKINETIEKLKAKGITVTPLPALGEPE